MIAAFPVLSPGRRKESDLFFPIGERVRFFFAPFSGLSRFCSGAGRRGPTSPISGAAGQTPRRIVLTASP